MQQSPHAPLRPIKTISLKFDPCADSPACLALYLCLVCTHSGGAW